MEQEKSLIEVLKEFAKRTGRKADSNVHVYPMLMGKQNVREQIIIQDVKNPCLYFINFLDTKEFGKYGNFSGIFFTIPRANQFKLLATEKHFLNKISLFKSEDTLKLGNSSFDSKVLVKSDNKDKALTILKSDQTLANILKALSFDSRMRVGVNNIEMNLVEEFKGKGVFGMFMVQDWFSEENRIEELFSLANEIQQTIGFKTEVKV